MACNVNFPAFPGGGDKNTCLIGFGLNSQGRFAGNGIPVAGCMPRLGREKLVVKTPKQGRKTFVYGMGKNTKELFGKPVFGDAVMPVQTRLGTPAYMHGRPYIRPGIIDHPG
jgi:hypothetical protein